jgi:hypothetical protein
MYDMKSHLKHIILIDIKWVWRIALLYPKCNIEIWSTQFWCFFQLDIWNENTNCKQLFLLFMGFFNFFFFFLTKPIKFEVNLSLDSQLWGLAPSLDRWDLAHQGINGMWFTLIRHVNSYWGIQIYALMCGFRFFPVRMNWRVSSSVMWMAKLSTKMCKDNFRPSHYINWIFSGSFEPEMIFVPNVYGVPNHFKNFPKPLNLHLI